MSDLNQAKTAEGTSSDKATSFKSNFPVIYNFYLDACYVIKEMTEAVNSFFPSWFDFVLLVTLLIAFECIKVVCDRSFILMGCITFSCLFIKRQLDESDDDIHQTNKESTETQGQLTEHEPLQNSREEQQNKIAVKKDDLLIQFIIAYGIIVCSYFLWDALIRFMILSVSCRKGINSMKSAMKNIVKKTWRGEVNKLAEELVNKVDSSEPVLISFFSEALQRLWPFADRPLVTFLTTIFSQKLKDRLCANSVGIHKLPLCPKDSAYVTSAKVIDKGNKKVVIDVGIMYTGYYTGITHWMTRESYVFETFKLDAKLRFTFYSLSSHLPFGTNTFLSLVIQDADIVSILRLFDRINISLKKINQLDTWREADSHQPDASDPIKKRFLKGAQEVIHSLFPLDHLLEEAERTPTTPELGTAPQQPPNLNRGQEITPRRQPAQQRTTTTPTVSPQVGRPSSLPSQTGSTPAPSKLLNRPSSTEGSIRAVATHPVELSRSSSKASVRERANIGATSLIGTQASAQHSALQEKQIHREKSSVAVQQTANSKGNALVEKEVSGRKTNVDEISGPGAKKVAAPLPPSVVSSGQGIAADKTSDAYGSVELTTFLQTPGSLNVTVHKLRNLPKNKGRMPQPYVKLTLQTKDKKDLNESTEIFGKATDAVFEKTFNFQLEKPLSEYKLVVKARTKHTLNHTLSQVVLSFVPSSNKAVEVRRWYDLGPTKKDGDIQWVEYKN